MCRIGRSLFERGYVHATAGNISVRLTDGFLITPTDACLGQLDPARLARLDAFWAGRDAWLPTPEDRAYVRSVMVPVYEPGKFAPWIAPPDKGVNNSPIDFEYVKWANT